MNYKEGQRVKLRNDLEVGKIYNRWTFPPHGEPFIGELVTLGKWTGYQQDGNQTNGYFSVKEAGEEQPLFVTVDLIDPKASAAILNKSLGKTIPI